MEHKNLNNQKTAQLNKGAVGIGFVGIGDVSGSTIKPPLGLIPKKLHDERVKVERFHEVCGAIARYYDAGLKINIEWIEEYYDLVDFIRKHYSQLPHNAITEHKDLMKLIYPKDRGNNNMP